MKTAATPPLASGSETPEFCSTKQAAEMIGVSHRTVQLWVESGVLQAWKTAGGHRRITTASVLKLVDQRREAIGGPAVPAALASMHIEDGKKKLLIVDDDATMLRLYELEMSGWGLAVELIKASNGFEALIKIGESKPDMLISDLNMPGMDGFRMIRTLRADSAYAGMAIVVISGLDQATVASMGLPGDIPFFSKPASFARLRPLVESALEPA